MRTIPKLSQVLLVGLFVIGSAGAACANEVTVVVDFQQKSFDPTTGVFSASGNFALLPVDPIDTTLEITWYAEGPDGTLTLTEGTDTLWTGELVTAYGRADWTTWSAIFQPTGGSLATTYTEATYFHTPIGSDVYTFYRVPEGSSTFLYLLCGLFALISLKSVEIFRQFQNGVYGTVCG